MPLTARCVSRKARRSTFIGWVCACCRASLSCRASSSWLKSEACVCVWMPTLMNSASSFSRSSSWSSMAIPTWRMIFWRTCEPWRRLWTICTERRGLFGGAFHANEHADHDSGSEQECKALKYTRHYIRQPRNAPKKPLFIKPLEIYRSPNRRSQGRCISNGR